MQRLRCLFFASILAAFPAFLLAEPVDINTADATALATNLKGIGKKRAEDIVAYRNEHGPFASIEDLNQVKGVGPSIVEQNRANLKIGQK